MCDNEVKIDSLVSRTPGSRDSPVSRTLWRRDSPGSRTPAGFLIFGKYWFDPSLKGTVPRDFLYPVFFTNQLLLVPLEMP